MNEIAAISFAITYKTNVWHGRLTVQLIQSSAQPKGCQRKGTPIENTDRPDRAPRFTPQPATRQVLAAIFPYVVCLASYWAVYLFGLHGVAGVVTALTVIRIVAIVHAAGER